MVRVGICGIGFMGMIHYLTYQKLAGVKVVAMSEIDKKRLAGNWQGIKGNFGPAGTKMDLSDIATYTNVEDLIADPNVDLVDVTLPPWLHYDIATKALKAGKHVFCEKPICLDPAQAKRLVASASKAERQLMIGHVLPFFPEYAWARKVVASGRLGKLLGGNFNRVISDPAWLPHFWDPERTGGPMLDLHVHDAHFIRLMFGMPTVVSTAGRMRGSCAEYWNSQFTFADKQISVTANSGTITSQARSFLHGFEIQMEKGTLAFEFAVTGNEGKYHCAPVQIGPGKRVSHPTLGDGDPMLAFEAELKEVVKGVRTGKPSEILGGSLAHDALVLCHKQTQSLARGRPVKV